MELADRAGQALGAAGAGHDADADFRLAELGAFAGHDDVGHHGELQPAAEREAVYRGDHRLRGGGNGAPEPLHAAARDLYRVGVDKFLEVGARGKRFGVAGQHDRPHAGVVRQRREGLRQRLAGGHVQRVAGLRPVQPHDRNPVFRPFDQNRCLSVAHRRLLRSLGVVCARSYPVSDFRPEQTGPGAQFDARPSRSLKIG